MSDRDKRQLHNDDLRDVKSLIGDATGAEFDLDDILAEYGSGKSRGRGAVPVATKEKEPEPDVLDGPDLPWPEASAERVRERREKKIVAFPGAAQESPEEEYCPEEEPAPEEEAEEVHGDDRDDGDRVIEFPEEESVLSAFLKNVGRKADDYADRMFEEDERTDPEQVRRLERLIPGTDQEEEWPEEDLRRVRPRRKMEPPPPDLSPKELARDFGRGLKGMRVRSVLLLFLFLVALGQLLVPALGFVWKEPLHQPVVQAGVAAGLMGIGMLLGIDVILGGLGRGFRGKVGMDTLTSLSAILVLADGLVLTAMPETASGRLPYTAVALAGLWLALRGNWHKRCAQRLSCRTAAASAEPYRVTLDEGKWNGRDTFVKWSGTAEGFGSQIQMDDGAQRIFRRVCPLLLLGDVVLAVLATVAAERPEDLLWGLSALFTITAAFGGALAYGRAFHKMARRLVQSGAALAGWSGVADSRRGNRVLITDTDLFPPGYVGLNGYRVVGGFPMERVVAYTATLIRDSGSGLAKPFMDQLRTLGGMMRNAERLCCYEGGGLSATIRGDQVLVGSAAFMNLMEIPTPEGSKVKTTIFCAINGELAGIFALNYVLPDTVFPALEELIGEKVGPVLATRDFNLIPAMLRQRFKLAADKMDFPPVERRRELSAPDQPHNEVLTALLCREGLFPFAEAVTAAKRLRWAARMGAILCCAASVLGLLLGAYLVSAAAYGSLAPLNLLVYMVSWLIPVWLLTSWAHRY